MKNLLDAKFLLCSNQIDDRDYTLDGLLCGGDFKPLLYTYHLPVKDQGDTMKCVGYSHASALEMLYGTKEYLSHDFIYANRDLSCGKDNPFQGYYDENAENHLLEDGTCTYSEYHSDLEMSDLYFDLDKKKKYLLPKCKYKIKAHVKLNSIEEVKAFMNTYKNNGVVITSINVFESVGAVKEDGIFPYSAGNRVGGHSMCCVGYDDKYIIVLNSIGAEWGKKGYGYIPQDDDKVFQTFRGIIIDDGKADLSYINIPDKTNILYRVQIGAFKNKEYAMNLQEQLANQELTKQQKATIGSTSNYLGSCLIYENGLYKVQVGSFRIKENANNLQSVLRELGYTDCWITEFKK